MALALSILFPALSLCPVPILWIYFPTHSCPLFLLIRSYSQLIFIWEGSVTLILLGDLLMINTAQCVKPSRSMCMCILRQENNLNPEEHTPDGRILGNWIGQLVGKGEIWEGDSSWSFQVAPYMQVHFHIKLMGQSQWDQILIPRILVDVFIFSHDMHIKDTLKNITNSGRNLFRNHTLSAKS